MDPTPKKWWSGWPEWLAGTVGRWCNRHRAIAAERRLTTENESLRGQVKALEVELEQANRDLESRIAEVKVQEEFAKYLEKSMAHYRQQLEADAAVTAKRVAEGETHGKLRGSNR